MSRRWVLRTLALAAVNFVAGSLGLLLAVPPGYATAVWPPSGIALAAFLLWGGRASAGVFLGAFLINLGVSFDGPSVAAVIRSLVLPTLVGLGSTAQAATGAYLIRRCVGSPGRLDSNRGVFLFLLLGGPVSCLVAATVGVSTLWWVGALSGSATLFTWWTWWAGDSLGVVVFTPLLLLVFTSSEPVWDRRIRAVTIPMLAMFSITVALFLAASGWERHRIRLEFERHAARGAEFFELELGRSLEVLNSIERFYASSEEVDRDDFHRFVSPLFPPRPGLVAVAWNPRVPASERRAYEALARRDGFAQSGFTELGATTRLIPAGPRSEYIPILFAEPEGRDGPVIGFDLASEPTRRSALERARETGAAAATGRVTLVQDLDSAAAFVIFQPIYRRGFPRETLEERRRNLLGYASGVVRIAALVGAAQARIQERGISLTLLDETGPAGPDILHPSTHGNAGVGALTAAARQTSGVVWERRLEVAGRRWTIRFTPNSDYLVTHRSWAAWVLLAGGLLFAGMLQGFLLVLTGNAVRTERLVADRTFKLEHANRSLSEEVVIRKIAEWRAVQAARVKSEFMATMSHELRTPLNSVIGFTHVLLENRGARLSSEELTWLQRVQANGRHLLGLINSVLDLSKLEAGRLELELTRASLEPMITETVAHLAPLLVGRPIEIRTEIPARLLPLEADHPKLRQILLNLVSNAVKFTERGHITIRVQSDHDGRPLSIDVVDSGISIPAHRHAAIFDAFEQGDNTISRQYGGSGLGLTISRALARGMGFDLSLRSELGIGSTFSLHLSGAAGAGGSSDRSPDRSAASSVPAPV